MLIQVRNGRFILGSLLGIGAAALMSWAWAHYGHRINVKRFFQVTGLFLLLFTVQILFYAIHEFSEAGVLGDGARHPQRDRAVLAGRRVRQVVLGGDGRLLRRSG